MTRRKMLLMTAGATVLGLAALVGFADQNAIFADDDDDEGQEKLIKNVQQPLDEGRSALSNASAERRRSSLGNGVATLNSLRTTLTVLASMVMLVDAAAPAHSAEASPLQLETKIVLGDVRGRIDHMAIDLKRQRLFVAELGNDSVGIVDLANRKLIHRISGLKEPQGVGYEASTDMLYVANAGDGSGRLFEGNDYKPAGQIELGSDADNIPIDAATNRVFIAYGSGALAILNAAPPTRI